MRKQAIHHNNSFKCSIILESMGRTTIMESDSCTILLSDEFRLGRGFVFPYGQVEMSDYGIFASGDSELPEEAEVRLNNLNEEILRRDVKRQSVIGLIRKPLLEDLAYIFSFIRKVHDAGFQEKFFSLLCHHPFFGFDKSYLLPGKGIVVTGPLFKEEVFYQMAGLVDFPINDSRFRIFQHDPGSKNSFQRYSLEGGKPESLGLLERLIGRPAIRAAINLAQSCSVVKFGSIEELEENPTILLQVCNRPCYNDLQIEDISASLASDHAKNYSSKIVRGVPYMQANSQRGTDPERGRMIYDEINFTHDFWTHKPSCRLYGYTFGIIK